MNASSARRVTILGASGSIGASTAAVIGDVLAAGEKIEVQALTVGRNLERLVALVGLLNPRFVAVADADLEPEARRLLDGSGVVVAGGPAGLVEAAAMPADWVMSAIVGAAALDPTLAAIEQGAAVALANKECIVTAGPLMHTAARASGARLLPVDSELNAIFQVLQDPEQAEKITLTASGGPFRTASLESMAAATPAEACAHPNWSMGAKISVDSATLMNKGLELIETAHFFEVPEDRIEVLVHPQSVIHGLVTYRDGSSLAQMASPDMRVPIAHALAWPRRTATGAKRLDLAAVGTLTFEAPDHKRFPALNLAREAARTGGVAPTVLNAANEIAVERFLQGRLRFLDIVRVVDEVLQSWDGEGRPSIAKSPSSFDHVRSVDAAARSEAQRVAARLGG